MPQVTNLHGEALDAEELRDVAAMFLDTRRHAQDILTAYRRATLRGQADVLAQAQRDAELEISIIRNAWRTWREAGGLNTYYQVITQPAVHHSQMGCRTIGIRTGLRLVPALTGHHPQDVAELGYRLCGHCLRRTVDESYVAAGKLVERVTRLLAVICKHSVCTRPQNLPNVANTEIVKTPVSRGF